MKNYTIGQVAQLVELPTKTIRFYEESGVISLPKRAENGYRLYSNDAVEELRLLKYARDLGLPLVEIKKLMIGCDHGDCHHSKEYIDKSINDYVARLNSKILELTTLKNKLVDLKETFTETENCTDGPFCCNIFHQLTQIKAHAKGGDSNERIR